MSMVWDLNEANPPQVSRHLRKKLGDELSPKTTGILLARLEEKGYLRSSPRSPLEGRGRPSHFYEALVTREESLRLLFEKFLQDHRLTDDQSLSLLKVLLAQFEEQLVESSPARA